jgi:hypothetical protein
LFASPRPSSTRGENASVVLARSWYCASDGSSTTDGDVRRDLRDRQDDAQIHLVVAVGDDREGSFDGGVSERVDRLGVGVDNGVTLVPEVHRTLAVGFDDDAFDLPCREIRQQRPRPWAEPQMRTWPSRSIPVGGDLDSASSTRGTITIGNAAKIKPSEAICIPTTRNVITGLRQGASCPYPVVVNVCMTISNDSRSVRGRPSKRDIPTSYASVNTTSEPTTATRY